MKLCDDSYDNEDSYDSYGEVDGRPECFDSGDYEEWCAWNDVDEGEGYYVLEIDLETVVAVVYEPSREAMPGFGGAGLGL